MAQPQQQRGLFAALDSLGDEELPAAFTMLSPTPAAAPAPAPAPAPTNFSSMYSSLISYSEGRMALYVSVRIPRPSHMSPFGVPSLRSLFVCPLTLAFSVTLFQQLIYNINQIY